MKLTLPIRTYIWALLMAPFIRPGGIHVIIRGSQYIYDALSLGTLAVIVFIAFYRKKSIVNRFVISSVVLFSLIFLMTVFYDGDVMLHLRITVTCLGIILSTAVLADSPKTLYSALMIDLEVLIYINALSIILYPHGMYLAHGSFGSPNNWFMGYDNHWFIFYYAAYYIALANWRLTGEKLRAILLITVLHLTSLYTMSGVLVIGVGLMDIVFLTGIYKREWFSFRLLATVGFAVAVVLVLFSATGFINYLIAVVLQKTSSIYARNIIWRRALNIIRSHFIFGYGRRSEKQSVLLYGMASGVNSHSMWLEILFEGGIIGSLAFLTMLVSVGRKLDGLKNGFHKLILLPFTAIFITMSIDAFIDTRGVMFFFLLAAGYFMRPFEVQKESVREKPKIRFRLSSRKIVLRI